MNLRVRRIGTTCVAATLLCGLLASAPGPALAGGARAHTVDVYKQEAWLALGGQFPDNEQVATVSCHDGDYALDGMWLVDAYDTPNPDSGVAGDERDLRVEASYSDAAHPERWNFRMANLGTGRVQIKIFVTCLAASTGVRDGHQHDTVVSDRPPAGSVTITHLPVTLADPCQPGELAVAPGYDFTSTSPRMLRSWPRVGENNWFWSFDIADGDMVDATLYLRCLSPSTSAAAGHVHALDLEWIKQEGVDIVSLPAGEEVHTDVRAGPHRDAAVGAVQVPPFDATYLGATARGRLRTFRFWNDTPIDVSLGVLTIGHRTGPQLAP